MDLKVKAQMDKIKPFIFTVVPGATYYYKQNDDDPWSKTTDPTKISYGFEK